MTRSDPPHAPATNAPSPAMCDGTSRILSLLCLAFVLLWAPAAWASLLSYQFPSPLVKSGCAGDLDNDCLDNVEEGNLAGIAAPWIFYDEHESCATGLHFARRDYFQVRPQGSGVGAWSATDGKQKRVAVTYYLL